MTSSGPGAAEATARRAERLLEAAPVGKVGWEGLALPGVYFGSRLLATV